VVLFLAWTGLVIAAQLLPFYPEKPLVGIGFDKVVHTAMFTVTGTLAQAALPWVSLVATVPMAIGLELAQKRIPNRSYNRVELLANVLGVVLGAGLFELAQGLRRR
jgi:hypothetical protein